MYKTAIVFPGQGSQYVGMGQVWHSTYPIARELFEMANDALGFDLKKIDSREAHEYLARRKSPTRNIYCKFNCLLNNTS